MAARKTASLEVVGRLKVAVRTLYNADHQLYHHTEALAHAETLSGGAEDSGHLSKMTDLQHSYVSVYVRQMRC